MKFHLFQDTIDSNWIIATFKTNHKHVMVSPRSVSYIKCHKNINVTTCKDEGILTKKVATTFNDDDSTSSNKDCWNHIRHLSRKNLDVGYVQVVYNYCKQK